MNHFQAILTQVRMLLSSHRPSLVQALLDSLLKEELLSREYHCTLLHEPDSEALARKISLTLLEKGDLDLALQGWAWSGLQPPAAKKGPGHRDRGGLQTASVVLMVAQGQKAEPSSLPGRSPAAPATCAFTRLLRDTSAPPTPSFREPVPLRAARLNM
ncbi:hypothetical protein P7K49_023051 [Saguinus oedipus]|uniref:MHC class II transactivator n=1 Tax=Saguinus oedipus TaxID=9490 RepID=A0ABQ9ULF2_SAGOE|nr:hypothetical protein P7K49_023051 [Saguinus oedipus]